MPKYKFEGTTNWCGTEETFVVEADNENEAEQIAREYWVELVSAEVSFAEEIDDDEADDYEQIN